MRASAAKTVDDYLAAEMEGGLFVLIFMLSNYGESFSIQKVFYTVEGSVVFELSPRGKYPSGDSLISIKAACRRVGDYDPNHTYTKQTRDFPFEKIDGLFATELQPRDTIGNSDSTVND